MKYTIETPDRLIAGEDYSGLFITFEGPEGAGKSLQSSIIHKFLTERLEYVAPWTKEPGGPESSLQTSLREIYFPSTETRSDIADLFFMLTDRALHQRFLREHLKEGYVVTSDRYADSTRAYQSGGGGLALDVVDAFNAIATNGLTPDITFLVDVEVETGFKRKGKIPEKADHFERKERDYHEGVRQGYLNLVEENPDRFILIDGEQSIETVTAEILTNLVKHPAYQAYLERTE